MLVWKIIGRKMMMMIIKMFTKDNCSGTEAEIQSATAEEVSRFQRLSPNPNWLVGWCGRASRRQKKRRFQNQRWWKWWTVHSSRFGKLFYYIPLACLEDLKIIINSIAWLFGDNDIRKYRFTLHYIRAKFDFLTFCFCVWGNPEIQCRWCSERSYTVG